MLRSTISSLFLILYGSNGMIHWFRLVVLLWLHFVFRFLVSCWLSFCKWISCWGYDIWLIGWLLSAMVFIPICFRPQMRYFHLFFFSLFVQMHCSAFAWCYLWHCFAVFLFLLPRDWLVDWPIESYMVLLMIWCLVCLICVPFAEYFCTVIYGYYPSMFDWLVDRPIDRSVHLLIGWLLAERL